MVDRINKVLRKLSAKDYAIVIEILEQIRSGSIAMLDLKKMQGVADTYRVRKGNFRIIFFMPNRETIRIISVERRTDSTYRDF